MEAYNSLHPPSEVVVYERTSIMAATADQHDDSSLGSMSSPGSPMDSQSEEASQSCNNVALASRLLADDPDAIETPHSLRNQAARQRPKAILHMTEEHISETMNMRTNIKVEKEGAFKVIPLVTPIDEQSDSEDCDMPPSLSIRRNKFRLDLEEKKSSTPPPAKQQGVPIIRSILNLPFEDESVLHGFPSARPQETLCSRHKIEDRSPEETETSSLDGQPFPTHNSTNTPSLQHDCISASRGATFVVSTCEATLPCSVQGRQATTVGKKTPVPMESKSLCGSEDDIDAGIEANPTDEMTDRRCDMSDPVDAWDTPAGAEVHLVSERLKTMQVDPTVSESLKESTTRPLEAHYRSISESKEKGMLLQQGEIEGQGVAAVKYYFHKLPLVKSLDFDIGICKGDAMLSVISSASTNADLVHEAIWRARKMRRYHDCARTQQRETSADSDNMRDQSAAFEQKCLDSIERSQDAAFQHLLRDGFEDARVLYDDILQTYQQYYELCLKRGEFTKMEVERGMLESKVYVGAIMHNVGLILLLNSSWQDAFAYLERASWNRSYGCWGDSAHISSLARTAIACFALNDLVGAQKKLEEALRLAKAKLTRLSDHHLLAEILNNLGCISLKLGIPDQALQLFDESLLIQERASKHSLYVGGKFACHQEILQISITKANIAFASLDNAKRVALFESAARDQLVLFRFADTTLIPTLEHLADAHLVAEDNVKALQILRRILNIQCGSFGAEDSRASSTANRIAQLQSIMKITSN